MNANPLEVISATFVARSLRIKSTFLSLRRELATMSLQRARRNTSRTVTAEAARQSETACIVQ
jgi:hypothetical protein